MKVLVVAPQPFYQERGTPIAVDLLLRALSQRGDQVDVLTYHAGEDRRYAGVGIHRIRRPIVGGRTIRPGPSWKKLVCDLYLFASMASLLRRQRYDVIHAVEESVFMALLLKPIFGVPFVYDMDSSMTTQLVDRYPLLRRLQRPLRYIETLPVSRAEAVVPVCDALAGDIARHHPRYVAILRDISLLRPDQPDERVENLREDLGINGSLSMYIGNLEPYQGIGLLLRAFRRVHAAEPEARLVVIGGDAEDVERYRRFSKELGLPDRVHFLGKRPLAAMGGYLRQADILISPRTHGVNTPMKIYSYLHSGVAVLATCLPTHTQVMTSRTARLAAPDPENFGQAWLALLSAPEERRTLAAAAHAYIEQHHSYAAFRQTLNGLYAHLERTLCRTPDLTRSSHH